MSSGSKWAASSGWVTTGTSGVPAVSSRAIPSHGEDARIDVRAAKAHTAPLCAFWRWMLIAALTWRALCVLGRVRPGLFLVARRLRPSARRGLLRRRLARPTAHALRRHVRDVRPDAGATSYTPPGTAARALPVSRSV